MAPGRCGQLSLPDTPAPPPGVLAQPHPSFDPLKSEVQDLLDQAGASGGISLVELGGNQPQTWSLNGDDTFVAASTYKLPLLMLESEQLAARTVESGDLLCYQDGDWEDGWYADYQDGSCYTRSDLMQRIGQDSDNTAAHILVRYEGGADPLNAYAAQHGAMESAFYDPNTTTSNDLARLMSDEANGRAGGSAAQGYLYPLLTHTAFEDGIPVGVPDDVTVVHKIGTLGDEVNDVGLVQSGPSGPYVLAICTQGVSGDGGWELLADISRSVWRYESGR